MSLTKFIRIAFLTLGAALLSYAVAQAQTGNTGGSSGGTGGGQSGLGSGPATGVPSAGGGTFRANPDANPYAKESNSTETTAPAEKRSTTRKSHQRASKHSKRASTKAKKNHSPAPAASASPTVSPSR